MALATARGHYSAFANGGFGRHSLIVKTVQGTMTLVAALRAATASTGDM